MEIGPEEEEKILVKQFKVQGVTLIDPETVRSITAPYENKLVSFKSCGMGLSLRFGSEH